MLEVTETKKATKGVDGFAVSLLSYVTAKLTEVVAPGHFVGLEMSENAVLQQVSFPGSRATGG